MSNRDAAGFDIFRSPKIWDNFNPPPHFVEVDRLQDVHDEFLIMKIKGIHSLQINKVPGLSKRNRLLTETVYI